MNNSRVVSAASEEITKVFEEFENIHLQYVTKIKGDVADQENKDVYNTVYSSVQDAFLEAEDHFAQERELAENTRLKRKMESLAAGKDAVISQLKDLEEKMYDEGDGWKPDLLTASAKLVEADRKMSELNKVLDDLLESELRESERRRYVAESAEFDKKYKGVVLRIKSYVNRNKEPTSGSGGCGTPHGCSGRSTRENSAERTSDHGFKTKKMEFPKFSGSIRQYVTFKRDFQEIVGKSGYSDTQLSHILRNECLQGEPRAVVHNIYEYEDIWEKLEEKYNDETHVVQLITKQITSLSR